MKGSSKVIMGATLVMVVSLAIVLGLILVLLTELYCSLLLRRRQLRTNSSSTTTSTTTRATGTAATTTSSQPSSQPQDHHPGGPSLGSFLGVLRAPRSFLFPSVSCKEDNVETKKQLHSQLHQVFDIPNQEISSTTPCLIGVISSPSPSISFVTSPQPTQEDKAEDTIQGGVSSTGVCKDKAAAGGGGGGAEHFVYISNPFYDNEARRPSGENTPFETPDTSPSRLEMGGSSSSGEDEVAQPTPSGPSSPTTPPLTPMKKLPAEACSVSLRDARSLGTSGSDSNTNNGLSSSSSGSPCTSPSW